MNSPTRRDLQVRQPDGEQDIDFEFLFASLLEKKWIIVGVALLGLFLGALYGELATPVYKGDTLFQIEQKSSGIPGLSELNQAFQQESSAPSEMEILRSRMVLGDAIKRLNMDIQVSRKKPPFIGRFLKDSARPGYEPMFAGYHDNKTYVKVDSFSVPESFEGRPFILKQQNGKPALYLGDREIASAAPDQPLQSDDGRIRLVLAHWQYGGEPLIIRKLPEIVVINRLRASISTHEVGRNTGMVNVDMTGTQKGLIKATLDAISDTYILQNVERRSAQAENSLDFLNKQLPKIKEKLSKSEDKLNQYREKSESVDLSLETQAVLQRVVDIESRLNELKVKENEMATQFTPEHPAYKALVRQRSSLMQEKKDLDKQIKKLPKTQQEMLRLRRDVEVTQQIYVGLLNKVQELKIMKAGTVGSVRVIDKPLVQPAPIKPKKAVIALAAAVIGALLAVAVVLLRALLNKGIESPDKLEELGIPVYATVPLSEQQTRKERLLRIKQRREKKGSHAAIPLLAKEFPGDLAIESLRSLRTSLHFAMMDAGNNVIMITGPSPGVGKSFLSANLGVVLAQAGQRVLVIDADLRKGHLHRYFECNNDQGLSSYLSGQAALENVVQPSLAENLDFIARGKAPPNPSELLMHERFKSLMDNVSDSYDLVLVDSPPVLAVTDAAIIGQLAGSSLLVTRFGMNSVKEVDAALNRFAQSNVDIKGAILNCMERRATNEYGYYAYEYGRAEND